MNLLRVLLPCKLKVFIYKKIFGWHINPNARIGFSLLLCDEVIMDEGTKIGSLTIVKGLSKLRMDKCSSLGSLN